MKIKFKHWIKKLWKKESVEKISAVIAVIGLYAGMQLLGITCPIKFMTGISCAGCGMTRAWLALLRLDFSKAFYYHPLFYMPPLVIILILMRNKINKKVYKSILVIVILLFAITYVFRMLSVDNEIVVFRPENGFIFQFIKHFTEIIY